MTVLSRNSVASPEALAAIPQSTLGTWPTGLVPQGHQPSERHGIRHNGALKRHAIGCRINGGPLPRAKCQKCREIPSDIALRALSAEARRR